MRAYLLAVPLLFVGCSEAQLGSSRVDPALAALVPSDTIMVSGVHMAELRSTSLYQKLIAQQRLSELDDFAKQTGFDPRRDVQELIAASNGVDTVVLARGAFKVQPPAGVKKSTYKGATIYGATEGAYAILDSSTAVAGVERAVRKAIDQKQSGAPGAKALLDRARALPSGGQVWFVANGWGPLPERFGEQGGNLANISRIVRSIESATGTIDLRSGIVASAQGQCRTDQDAKNLADAARGMVGMGRLSVPENQPEMLRLFDGIKVDQQQRSILLNVQIPPDLLDRLIKMTDTGPKPVFKKK
jgi:hypothetical protein